MNRGLSTARTLLLLTSLGWGLVIASLLVYSYLGIAWTEALSFRVEDGWCSPSIEGVGQHCFGDFGFPYYTGGFPTVYEPGNMVASNTPLTALAFEFVQILSYNIGLFLYLFTLLGSSLTIIWWGTRGLPVDQRTFFLVFLGAGSLGTIVAVDRGNHVALLALLGLLFVLAIESRQRKWAIILCALLIGLKFWGFVFLIGLLARRRYLDALIAAVAAFVTSIAVLYAFPGTLRSNIELTLAAAGNHDYALRVTAFAISVPSLMRRFACGGANSAGCDVSALQGNWSTSSLFTLTIVGIFLVWAWISIRVFPRRSALAWIPLLTLPIVALPESASYNACFALAAAALLLRWSRVSSSSCLVPAQSQKLLLRLAVICVAISTIPLVVYIPHEFPFAIGDQSSPPTLRSQYLTIPAAWAIYFAVSIGIILRSRGSQSKMWN
jgi:hypothetical protein